MTIEILTGLLVALTSYYAITTHRILKANEKAVSAVKEQNEALARPYVHATLGLLSNASIYVLSIKNHGKSQAINLKLSINKDFQIFGSKNLRDCSAFSQTITSFPPEAEFDFLLATTADIHGKNEEKEKGFVVTIEYEFLDKKIIEETTIDFRPFLGIAIPSNDIANEIKMLSKNIEKMATKIQQVE